MAMATSSLPAEMTQGLEYTDAPFRRIYQRLPPHVKAFSSSNQIKFQILQSYFFRSCIMAPILEEIVFREDLQNFLKRSLSRLFKKNTSGQEEISDSKCAYWTRIILAASLFTIAHGSISPVLFTTGVALGAIKESEGLIQSMGRHSAHNFLIMLFVLFHQ
jgi:membrane protease YdiL (CAAX protease family)